MSYISSSLCLGLYICVCMCMCVCVCVCACMCADERSCYYSFSWVSEVEQTRTTTYNTLHQPPTTLFTIHLQHSPSTTYNTTSNYLQHSSPTIYNTHHKHLQHSPQTSTTLATNTYNTRHKHLQHSPQTLSMILTNHVQHCFINV